MHVAEGGDILFAHSVRSQKAAIFAICFVMNRDYAGTGSTFDMSAARFRSRIHTRPTALDRDRDRASVQAACALPAFAVVERARLFPFCGIQRPFESSPRNVITALATLATSLPSSRWMSHR